MLQLKTMTFNVRCDVPGVVEGEPDYWPVRGRVMSEMFRRMDLNHFSGMSGLPDIIGVQEFTPVHMAVFGDLGMKWFGESRDGYESGERNPIFYNSAKFAVIRSSTFWLSDRPWEIGSKTWGEQNIRICTWGEFIDLRTSERFLVANTHFDHVSAISRKRSAELLWDEFDLSGGNRRKNIILLGDLNNINNEVEVGLGVKEMVDGRQRGLTDSMVECGVEEETFHGYGIDGPARRLDWILHDSGIKAVTSEVLDYSLDGRYPSDHFPVVSELCII